MLLIIDNGSIHTPELMSYLKMRKVDFIRAKKNSRLKNIMKHKYKGVILTGGPLLFHERIKIEEIGR